ncbi:MAG: cryptochrome/photolyase family protein [Rhizobiaceae bacterium]
MTAITNASGFQTRSKEISPAIVWFRDDLRISDNPALEYAARQNRPVIPVYIFESEIPDHARIGGAQKWMLHHALADLANNLETLGSDLIIRKGNAFQILRELAENNGATSVYWNRRYTSHGIDIDTKIKSDFSQNQLEAKSFQASLLHEPARLLTALGGPYKVYSPFWRAFDNSPPPRPTLPKPDKLIGVDGIESLAINDLHLLPVRPDWSSGLRQSWIPSEAAVYQEFVDFIEQRLPGYSTERDIPAAGQTSRLSPFLRLGLISPYQVWYMASEADVPPNDKLKFLKELVWREFSYHLLYHFPSLAAKNFNDKFDEFPWSGDLALFNAWKRGKTGYPLVDAGMRELWHTGYMHNRVRMVAASFLVKHLLVDWRKGERWFWDTLVDADPASNAASWQWVAGSGADAAPYFRIFNPIIQAKKFDPDGTYVKKWVPELSGLPDRHVHEPWLAPQDIQNEAGLKMGHSYPFPIVDHKTARVRALNAYNELKKEYVA